MQRKKVTYYTTEIDWSYFDHNNKAFMDYLKEAWDMPEQGHLNDHDYQAIVSKYIENAITFEQEERSSFINDDLRTIDNSIHNTILGIATIGTWQGRIIGYKEYDHLDDILCGHGCDDYKIFSNGYNVLLSGCHHDGDNQILFRELKHGISDECYDRLIDALYTGKDADYYIKRYTRSILPEFKAYFGN